MKKGVYCSITSSNVKETHAGVKQTESYYNHICFYLPQQIVGFYGGSKNWLSPFLKKELRYIGEITSISDKEVSFYVNDPYNKDIILFTGQIYDDFLEVTAKRKSEIEKIWFEGTFKYIGTGEEKLD